MLTDFCLQTPPWSTLHNMVTHSLPCACWSCLLGLSTDWITGFIPQTFCDDEDPLDILVLMQACPCFAALQHTCASP